jgi:four helix bundle suffix protein
MDENQSLIPKHGGYRKLKSFQVAQLAYDLTVLFCQRYVDRFSRTRDQMVQAARSGVQNIAEGSQASATSKKTELKLTQVARASLEELKLDYEDFLRQRGLPMLTPDHPVLMRFKARRCRTLEEVRHWVREERQHSLSPSAQVPLSSACLAANAALSLLNLACYLLDRQVARLAQDFEQNGGFTERLYQTRRRKRGY